MTFDIFSSTLCTRLGLFYPTACGLSQCICGQPIDSIKIHLLHCVHGGECNVTHDAICDSFISIVRDVNFHVSCKQTHVLLTPYLQWLWQQVNIVFIIDGIRALVDVIIVDSTHANFISWVNFFLWNGCDNCSLGKGCVIFQLTPKGWIYPFCNKNIWMFISIGQRLLSSMF
jgi:hypothetical protein